MLSSAAILAWLLTENITTQRLLFGTDKDVRMAVAFCTRKVGGVELFLSMKQTSTKQNKHNILVASPPPPTQHQAKVAA